MRNRSGRAGQSLAGPAWPGHCHRVTNRCQSFQSTRSCRCRPCSESLNLRLMGFYCRGSNCPHCRLHRRSREAQSHWYWRRWCRLAVKSRRRRPGKSMQSRRCLQSRCHWSWSRPLPAVKVRRSVQPLRTQNSVSYSYQKPLRHKYQRVGTLAWVPTTLGL
jgi:hypothetical protein